MLHRSWETKQGSKTETAGTYIPVNTKGKGRELSIRRSPYMSQRAPQTGH